ncbi:hypothetical protein ACTXT7_014412 [Hymenolepis weldensis]
MAVITVISEDIFVVKTDLIGQDRVKLTWEDIPDKDGNSPARYRVLCTAPDSPAVEAVAHEKMVELSTFKEGLTYTCEVHPIFDDLVEGMEVISANPGTSAPFTIALQPANPASEEPSDTSNMKAKGIYWGYCALASSRAQESSTMIKFPKCCGQCNHIRDKPRLVCCSKRLTQVDDRGREIEEIGLAKPNLISSPTNVPWSHIALSHAKSIRRTSCQSGHRSYPLDLSQPIPLPTASARDINQSSTTRLDDVCRCLSVSHFHSPPNFNGLEEQIVDKVKRQLLLSLERTVEEILTCSQFRYRTMSHVGVQTRVHHRKHLRSQYAVLTSEPKTDAKKIYLEPCYLRVEFRNSGDPAQSSATPLLRTLQKTSEKLQLGTNI